MEIISEKKHTCLRRLTPFCTYFFLLFDQPHLLPLFHRSFLRHTLLPPLRNSFSASIIHPHAMGVGPSFFPLCLVLASWRSRSCSLKRDTHLEMTTFAVTETIRKRRSFNTLFLDMDPPSLPPTTLTASWSIKRLPSTPRCPKLSSAKVVSLWLHSSKDTCPGRA